MTTTVVPGFEFAATVTPHAESIDSNGHVNVGYYGVFFERAADQWLSRHGMSDAYIQSENYSLFAGETRTKYFREVLPGGRMDVHFRVEDLSPKALLAHMVMVDPADGELIAAIEVLWLSVDLSTRRVSPMKPSLLGSLEAAKARHHREPPDLPFRGLIAFRR